MSYVVLRIIIKTSTASNAVDVFYVIVIILLDQDQHRRFQYEIQ